MFYVLFVTALILLAIGTQLSRRSFKLAWGLESRRFTGFTFTQFGEKVEFSGTLYHGFETPILLVNIDSVQRGTGPVTDKLLISIELRKQLMAEIDALLTAEFHHRTVGGTNIFF